MRLGGPILADIYDPEQWIQALQNRGYTAAYWPALQGEAASSRRIFVDAAAEAGIVIAEIGAWSNPISPDDTIRAKAIQLCQERLALADEVGARCCVNIAGSRSRTFWCGPDRDNFSEETFELIVDTTRLIIDAVKPKRTFFTLETMQWVFPDSADSYLSLFKAINRKQFGVHFDPVNLITSPRLFFRQEFFIKDFVAKLGPYIKSCHAKDIALRDHQFTVQFDEVIPGQGGLNYRVLMRELASLDRDVPLMLEHLSSDEQYAEAARYLRRNAEEEGVLLF